MDTFHLRTGSHVPLSEKLHEGYRLSEHSLIANVSAEKMLPLLSDFIVSHDEPLFFILELPTNQEKEAKLLAENISHFHKDIYYIDGCSQEKAQDILQHIGALLCNDGLCSFGYGAHISGDEIMVEKYNVISAFSRNMTALTNIFEKQNIFPVKTLVTAWDTFSSDFPGHSETIETGGKTVYDIPDMYAAQGMYFAQRRED